LSYRYELIRKLIHLSNLVIPLFLFYNDKHFVLMILAPLSISFIFLDFLRLKTKIIAKLYNQYFSIITRDFESHRLTGASYVFFASCIVIYFYPPNIAIPALLIMSISDSMAAIVGEKYGKIKIFNKTLEGSIAFFLSSICIIIFFDLHLLPAILSIIITTLVESSKFLNIDDNLSVPLSFSISYSFFCKLLSLNII